MIRLCAVGDISLSDKVEEKITRLGFSHPFSKIKSVLHGNDIVIGNLENVFSDCQKGKTSHAHLLRSRPQTLKTVSDAGFNVVTLANNHILDFGGQALTDTQASLKSHNIQFTGAGNNLKTARNPAIISINNINFGFLAYAMKGTHSADEEKPGAAIADIKYIEQDISKVKSSVDHIIVSIHYGLEFIDYPHPAFREMCHEVARLGVSLILGHHPHVINGMEKIDNCLIFYSLGNFIFDPEIMDYKTQRSKENIILQCSMDKEKVLDYKIIPAFINDELQVEIANNEKQTAILRRFDEISARLTSKDYPDIYYKQAADLWPKINIMVNLNIIRKQGFFAFLKRLPRIKLLYFQLLFKFFVKKIFKK